LRQTHDPQKYLDPRRAILARINPSVTCPGLPCCQRGILWLIRQVSVSFMAHSRICVGNHAVTYYSELLLSDYVFSTLRCRLLHLLRLKR
jgi:hypothetical protein